MNMSKVRFLPLVSTFFLVAGCSSSFDSESEAIAACEEWAAKEGNYFIKLITPPSSSPASMGFLQELGKNYENNWFNASMTLVNSFGRDNEGRYSVELTKRQCINTAAGGFTGTTDSFSISGYENKNFKTGQVARLSSEDYSKFVSGDYRFQEKDLKKYAQKVQELITKRNDYKVVKEFEF